MFSEDHLFSKQKAFQDSDAVPESHELKEFHNVDLSMPKQTGDAFCDSRIDRNWLPTARHRPSSPCYSFVSERSCILSNRPKESLLNTASSTIDTTTAKIIAKSLERNDLIQLLYDPIELEDKSPSLSGSGNITNIDQMLEEGKVATSVPGSPPLNSLQETTQSMDPVVHDPVFALKDTPVNQTELIPSSPAMDDQFSNLFSTIVLDTPKDGFGCSLLTSWHISSYRKYWGWIASANATAMKHTIYTPAKDRDHNRPQRVTIYS